MRRETPTGRGGGGERQAAFYLAMSRPGPKTLLALDLEANENNPSNSMRLDQAEAFVRAVADVIPVGLCGRLRDPVCREDWALRIGKRSIMREARVALARRLAIIMHAMLRDGTDFQIA